MLNERTTLKLSGHLCNMGSTDADTVVVLDMGGLLNTFYSPKFLQSIISVFFMDFDSNCKVCTCNKICCGHGLHVLCIT